MTDKGYDLSAASRMLGKLIDPREQERIRRARIRRELCAWANARHVALEPEDIRFIEGEPTIDEMPADQWLEAMTEERP